MDPSSLIFVVIVAIWAAYLLGHWVRRRDQVATVRSVDRFSEAMRVLERRPAVRSVPLSRPNPRSYVVAPAREVAPQVSVKRAPAVARPAERPAVRPVERPVVRPAAPTRAPATGGRTRAAASPGPSPAMSPATSSRRRTSAGAARRTRGLVLLGLLAATAVAWLLVAVTSVVAWWVGALVTAALVAMLAHLRHSARQARQLARRRQRLDAGAASQARRQVRRQVVGEVVASHRVHPAPEDAPSSGAPEGPAEPSETNGWQPVPVPPPTYTLKPKAPPRARPALLPQARPAVEPPAAAPAVAAPSAPVAPSVPAFDLDEILERRIASGS